MKITQVKPLDIYQIHIVFDDGIQGEMDLTPSNPGSIFEQLEKNDLWKYPKVAENGNAIYRNDALDIDSLSCYIKITGVKHIIGS